MGGNQKNICDDAQERRVVGYPNQYHFSLFIAYCHDNLTCKSVSLNKILKEFFDGKEEKEKQRLMVLFKTMTPEQIERPGRY